MPGVVSDRAKTETRTERLQSVNSSHLTSFDGGRVAVKKVRKWVQVSWSATTLLWGWLRGRVPEGRDLNTWLVPRYLGCHSPGSPHWHKCDGPQGQGRWNKTAVWVCKRKGSHEQRLWSHLDLVSAEASQRTFSHPTALHPKTLRTTCW